MSRADTVTPAPSVLKELEEAGIPVVRVSALRAEGLEELRDAIARTVLEKSEQDRKLVGDVVPAGSLVLLVVPIDTGAPKGRLILPQVQAIPRPARLALSVHGSHGRGTSGRPVPSGLAAGPRGL